MNSKGITPAESTSICMKCLSKGAKHFYHINGRGYGSKFDGMDTVIQLCDDCNDEKISTYASELPIMEEYYERYDYEDALSDIVDSFDIRGKELFYNRLDKTVEWNWEHPQDWIDRMLNELSEEKCDLYGFPF